MQIGKITLRYRNYKFCNTYNLISEKLFDRVRHNGQFHAKFIQKSANPLFNLHGNEYSTFMKGFPSNQLQINTNNKHGYSPDQPQTFHLQALIDK